MEKLAWKWDRTNKARLGSAANPDATVHACLAAPKRGRFRWTTVVDGRALAVSVDTATAQKLAREALKAV